MEDRVKSVMVEVFNEPIEKINDEFAAHSTASWDSLKHVDLILALEKEFGIKFESEEIPTMINYRIIVNTIESYME